MVGRRRAVADVRVGRALRPRSSRTACVEVRGALVPRPSERVWGDCPGRGAAPQARCRTPAVARSAAATRREAAERAVRGGRPDRRTPPITRSWRRPMPSCIADAGRRIPERDGPVRVRASALALGPLLHVGVAGRAVRGARPADPRRARRRHAPASRRCATGPWATSRRRTRSPTAATSRMRASSQPGEGERLVEAVVALALAARPAAVPRAATTPATRRTSHDRTDPRHLSRAGDRPAGPDPRRGGRRDRARRRAPSPTGSPRTA